MKKSETESSCIGRSRMRHLNANTEFASQPFIVPTRYALGLMKYDTEKAKRKSMYVRINIESAMRTELNSI